MAGKIAAEFWLILYRNGRKRGQTSGKFVLLFFSLIISNSKNCITLLADIDKDSLVSKGKMPSTRFFLSGCIFVLNWPEKSAKSWPNCSADRATESVPIRETESGGPCRPIATEVNRDSESTYEYDRVSFLGYVPP